MKKWNTALMLFSFVFSTLTAQSDYIQFEELYLKPKFDKLEVFKKGLAAHNKKYHSKYPSHVKVYFGVTGPSPREYIWTMGPITFTQLDGLLGNTKHNIDWDKNVLRHCASISEVCYWRMNIESRYLHQDDSAFTKSHRTFHTIRPDQKENFDHLMKTLVQVYQSQDYECSFSVYWKYGSSPGPDVITELRFTKYGSLDQLWTTWVKDYEEIHGAGSWLLFLDGMAQATDMSKTYDELIRYVPELSGGSGF